MNDYMRALHQRFFQEPECGVMREELEALRCDLRDGMERREREKLLRLVDLGIELREETSLAAFMSGFRWGFGIAMEMERYSFEDEEEQRACEKAENIFEKYGSDM